MTRDAVHGLIASMSRSGGGEAKGFEWFID
jgi:hypothetical protein